MAEPAEAPICTAQAGGGMDIEGRFNEWVEPATELVTRPTGEFPIDILTDHLVRGFQTKVSWHWVEPDGSFGFQMSQPIPGWHDPADAGAWREAVRPAAVVLDPLLGNHVAARRRRRSRRRDTVQPREGGIHLRTISLELASLARQRVGAKTAAQRPE